jgi:hypothetical protein
MDNWGHRRRQMRCSKCIHFLEKLPAVTERTYTIIGRCRRHAPMANEGFPVVFANDWCGDFKLDENQV